MISGFKRILLPIDFSEHCDRVADYAAWFARISQGTVHLVHVVANPADPIYVPQEVAYWLMVEHSERKARELLEAAAQRCLPADCAREFHILQGDPYEKLMEAAASIRPDLVVLSSHGHSRIAHLVMGSVAEKITRHATCPVLLIHSKHEAAQP